MLCGRLPVECTMERLTLKFIDEDGTEQRVAVGDSAFTVGRHSACDLTYTDSRLSREHARLESDNGKYTLTDLGSSNGTTLNGSPVTGPAHLTDGDRIDLGGGLEIVVEVAREPDPNPVAPVAAPDAPGSAPDIGMPSQPVAAPPVSLVAAPPDGGIPTALFIVAPLLAIFVLAVVIGGIFIFGGSGKDVSEADIDDGPAYSDDDDPDYDEPVTRTPAPRDSPQTGTPPAGPSSSPSTSSPGNSSTAPSGVENTERAKVERNSTSFVRQMARNDPRAFLTGEQAAAVQAKIGQVGRSSAIADNINSARRNASAIKTLATQKNLRPQFLAVATITRLGSSRGDVLQAAQAVAEVYEKLLIQIGDENFDDALLMVAAYDQGAAGETMKMRNMLQSIAETPGSPGTREIRSIWYLHKAGRINQAEYDRALTFLAIGTIAQNPKEFGVNTEALRF